MPAADVISRGPISQQNGVVKSGLLIETMQLEEPRKSQPVPNHLLETKIYAKIAQNSMVMAKPSVVHFDGFEIGKKHIRSLSIVNVSMEVIRMHIIPPQTKYFYIKYTKSERLVPGLALDCAIEFTPDEWRYYYDCIRINCPGEENLVIPIHAYPVMSTKEFPQLFNFPPVPVGHKMTKVFPLRCEAPIDFEYQLTYVQPHQAFSVQPMSGIIPANGEAQVHVTFSPIEFHTACMRIQLVISQFNSNPIVCTFTGSSVPGLLQEETLKKHSFQLDESKETMLDPQSITPIERARKKKRGSDLSPSNVKQEIDYHGFKFPAQMNSPYAVSQVLNQQPGKLRAKDLREVIVTKDAKDEKPKVATRQMKEAKFEHQVRQNVYEERQNQLRWQSKLGDKQITTESRAKILSERNQAWYTYRYKHRGDPIEDEEYTRQCIKCTFKRTVRDKDSLPQEIAQFDMYTNDMWFRRHSMLSRFAQAARKIIIRQRAANKLKSLNTLLEGWKRMPHILDNVAVEQSSHNLENEKKDTSFDSLGISADKIKQHSFATYVPPNVKDDMAPDALGSVSYKPTEVVVKRKVPYFSLKVPQQYKLNCYKANNVQEVASGYVSLNMSKPLRTGAEDEVITLPSALVVKEISAVNRKQGSLVLDHIKEGAVTLKETVDNSKLAIASLVPPPALFQPMEYPPLHIFNPAPGLQIFEASVPYAETDSDFHLCPLPRYFRKDYNTNVHASTQRKYLDREDVIRGIMTWKKFPSQGLTSLSNTPTLTNVWVPRWDDPFDSELLPRDVPPLLDCLPPDDTDNIVDEKEDDDGRCTSRMTVSLTPEMVNAQFPIVDPSLSAEEKPSIEVFPQGNKMPSTNIPVSAQGPVPREKREEELEYFMTKKYNRLGIKIQARTNTLNSLITDEALVLK